MKKQDLTLLSPQEYIYLSQKLEFLTAEELENGAAKSFIVLKNRENMIKLIRLVFKNELSQEEQEIASDYYLHNIKKSELARKNGVSHKYVNSVLKGATDKLYTYLKYPLLMRFSILCPPEKIFDQLKEENCG